MAKKHIDIVDEDPSAEQSLRDMNKAFLASANGDWATASQILKTILDADSENFAVSLFLASYDIPS